MKAASRAGTAGTQRWAVGGDAGGRLAGFDPDPRRSGRGRLPDHDLPSSGSAKVDVHRWAMARWLNRAGHAQGIAVEPALEVGVVEPVAEVIIPAPVGVVRVHLLAGEPVQVGPRQRAAGTEQTAVGGTATAILAAVVGGNLPPGKTPWAYPPAEGPPRQPTPVRRTRRVRYRCFTSARLPGVRFDDSDPFCLLQNFPDSLAKPFHHASIGLAK